VKGEEMNESTDVIIANAIAYCDDTKNAILEIQMRNDDLRAKLEEAEKQLKEQFNHSLEVEHNATVRADMAEKKLEALELDIDKAIETILETPHWFKKLATNTQYFRTHDDCDGNVTKGVSVVISPDGDAWVVTSQNPFQSCRYRMPMTGGGASPRTRQALLILALAIKMDNDEREL
jgi:hypothetical protein